MAPGPAQRHTRRKVPAMLSINVVLADAVHLATARAAGATAFVTNDRRIRSTPRLDVVYLSELD